MTEPTDASANPQRQARILAAARQLIIRYGYDKTTMNEVAEAAGISKGAIYLHFKSKEALFDALVMSESDGVLREMLAWIENDPDGGTIVGLYTQSIQVVLGNPLIHAIMTRDTQVLGDMARRMADTAIGHGGTLFRLEFVRHLQAAGVIRADLDAETLAYVLTLIRYGYLTVHEIVPPEQAPPPVEVGRVLGMLLDRALEPEGGSDREAGRQALKAMFEALQAFVKQQQG